MPASTGSLVTKQTVYDEFITRIWNAAAATIVYNNVYNRGSTRMNTAPLGPASFTAPVGGVTAVENNTLITASSIMTVAKNYAVQTTVARRVRSGLITDGGGTIDDAINVCRLTDNYAIAYTYSDALTGVLTGVVTAPGLHTYLNAIRATASNAQTTATVVDLRVCHSSCHSSCHGSRGRR